MLKERGLIIHPNELDEVWLKRFADMELTVLGLHPVGGIHADSSLEKMFDEFDNLVPLIKKAERMGITVEYEMHTLSYLMPRSLYSEHLDWFRMNEKGQRIPDFNFCVSNSDAVVFLENRATELAKRLPSSNHKYYFWLDDVTGYSCHCEHCRDLSPSDQQLLAVNAIQRGVRRADSLGCVAYLAYMDSKKVPAKVTVEKGVFLEYAPIHRNMNFPINDLNCKENVSESEDLEKLLAFFGRDNSKVLEYWTDNSLLSDWKYPPKHFSLNTDVLQADVSYYRRLGFETVTAFACFLGKDYTDLYGQPDLYDYGHILKQS